MKQLIKEYLGSLGERDELDILLPELLSHIGMHVYSEPRTRGRQHGVDIAAAGRFPGDASDKVYLLSVKAHDLTRSAWDGDVDALRSSLNEIIDTYLMQTLPAEYQSLPKVICICVGGGIVQQVQDDVNCYIKAQKGRIPNLEYQLWDSDRIAGLIEQHYISERLLISSITTKLGRCVALPDEVEYFIANFKDMAKEIFDSGTSARTKDPAFHGVCLNLCLAVLLHHGEVSENVDAVYRAAEIAQVAVWNHLELWNPKCADRNRRLLVFDRTFNLYVSVGKIYASHITPCLSEPFRFALSVVGAQDEVDVNLKAFDVLGRLSSLALSVDGYQEKLPEGDGRKTPLAEFSNQLIDLVLKMLENVHTLATPMLECQLSAISAAISCLTRKDRSDVVYKWVERLANSLCGCVMLRKGFPTIDRDYEHLLDHVHDEHDETYIHDAWPASELIPYLLYLSSRNGWGNVYKKMMEVVGLLPKTTLQIWFPDKDIERHYADDQIVRSGLMLYAFDIANEKRFIDQIEQAINQYPISFSTDRTPYTGLPYAAFRQALMPLPPQLWGIG